MKAAELSKLYSEYRGKVMSYLNARISCREDAEDLCSSIFEKAVFTYDRYDEKWSSVGTWLYSITRNAVIDYYRVNRPCEELPEELAGDHSPENDFLREETLDELAGALESLPTELTDIIVLRYYDGLPLTEIAVKLGMSYGAVKLRHQKALTLLRTALKVT